jgi:hypothetical protein
MTWRTARPMDLQVHSRLAACLPLPSRDAMACFFNVCFQAPNVFAPPTHLFTHLASRSQSGFALRLFENKSRADHPDAVLPFSFSMSSSATLLLRTPGNRETVKKIHTPVRAATNFATTQLRAAFDQRERSARRSASLGDNALNQRIESPPYEAACIALPQCPIFFGATARILRHHGLFQLPSATFLLNACVRDHFFDQKFRLARNEQIDRPARMLTQDRNAKVRAYACRTFARNYAELGDDKKIWPAQKAGHRTGTTAEKIISRAWRPDARGARPCGSQYSCASRLSARHA